MIADLLERDQQLVREQHGGFERLSVLTHPDYPGRLFHPWSTPRGLRDRGLLLVCTADAAETDDIFTVDMKHLKRWEPEHPTWCVRGRNCIDKDTGAWIHEAKIAGGWISGGGKDIEEGWREFGRFHVEISVEQFHDAIALEPPGLTLSITETDSLDQLEISPRQLRGLAKWLIEQADAAVELVERHEPRMPLATTEAPQTKECPGAATPGR